MSNPKKPHDTNQLTKRNADLNTGDIKEVIPEECKDPAAVALGRKGGLKGGKARAEKLTAKQRSDIARKAARARWDKPKQQREDQAFDAGEKSKHIIHTGH